jgi:Carboxypeptidase regulatory-like domain/Bacterial Ig-like domain (group 2)
MRARRWMRPAGAAAALVVLAAGCGDVLAEPARGPARLSVSFAMAPGAPPSLQTAAGNGRAFDRVDLLVVRVARGEETVVADSFVVTPAGGEIRQTLRVPLDGGGEAMDLSVELRAGGRALFAGTQLVQLAPGRSAEAEVPVLPIPAEVRVARPIAIVEALGDTVTLSATVLFATGDTATGVPLAWTSLDPDFGQVVAGGRLVALREGIVHVSAAHGSVTGQGNVRVQPRVTSVSVTPAVDSIILGDTTRLAAVARDRRGNVLTGRAVAWTSGGPAATVSSQGRVTGAGVGTAIITATVEGQAGTASVAVMNPARVYGSVRDYQTLSPLAGATLTLTAAAGGGTRTVNASAQGTYSITGLRPGTYTLAATANAHAGNTADAVQLLRVMVGDVVQVGFDLPVASSTPPAVAGLAGRVRTSAGTPVGGVVVQLHRGTPADSLMETAVTASDGTYAFPGIDLTSLGGQPIASYTVEVWAGSVRRASAGGVVLAAGRTRTNLDMVAITGTAPR